MFQARRGQTLTALAIDIQVAWTVGRFGSIHHLLGIPMSGRSPHPTRRLGMTRHGHSYLDLTALPEIGSLLLAPNPAWLWSLNNGAVLWANAAGAAFVGVETIVALLDADSESDFGALNVEVVSRDIGEAMPQMRQLPLGIDGQANPLWCLCRRLDLDDGTGALLAVATDEGGGAQPLSIRAGRLVQSIADDDVAAALMRQDGRIVAASEGFSELRDTALNLSELARESNLGGARLTKRRLSFDDKPRLAGAAAVSTPEGNFVLVLVGPAERPAANAKPDEPTESEDRNSMAAPDEREGEVVTPVPQPIGDRPGRFTFSLGPNLAFAAVSDELSNTVGPSNADIVGHSWDDISKRLDLDPRGTISKALASRDTWSGVTVRWPADGGGTATVDLTAIPSFRNGGEFEGFRGFGVVRFDEDPVETEAREDVTKPNETVVAESNVVRLPSAARTRNEALSGDEQDDGP